MEEDIELAKRVSEIDIIMGGHEHENIKAWRGNPPTLITKADANARTAYVHRITYDSNTDTFTQTADLTRVYGALPDDANVAKRVAYWENIAFAGFKSQGFDPDKLVTNSTDDLDGREASVRNQPTKLTNLITDGMIAAHSDAVVSISNSGSVRIDDVIPAGRISEYDVIRILPFGGDTILVKMKGSVLKRTLDQGEMNVGSGGFLIQSGAQKNVGGEWEIAGSSLDENAIYDVAIAEFLLTGKEKGLDFLNIENANPDELKTIESLGDVRNSLISQLKATYGAPD